MRRGAAKVGSASLPFPAPAMPRRRRARSWRVALATSIDQRPTLGYLGYPRMRLTLSTPVAPEGHETLKPESCPPQSKGLLPAFPQPVGSTNLDVRISVWNNLDYLSESLTGCLPVCVCTHARTCLHIRMCTTRLHRYASNIHIYIYK